MILENRNNYSLTLFIKECNIGLQIVLKEQAEGIPKWECLSRYND